MSFQVKVRIVHENGGEDRVGFIVQRTTDESLLKPQTKGVSDRGSNLLLHLDDGGAPIPLNWVKEIRRERG